MKTTKGYNIEEIGTSYYVVYAFGDGEKMLMSKPYRSEKSCKKFFDRLMIQCGVTK